MRESTYPPKVAAALRAFVQSKKDAGICTDYTCHNKASPGVDRCDRCRDRNAERCRRRQKTKRESNV